MKNIYYGDNLEVLRTKIKNESLTEPKVFFAPTPDSNSCFHTKYFSEHITSDIFYKISLATNGSNMAEFELINQPNIVIAAIRYPEDMLFRACDNENDFKHDATKIITAKKGTASKHGDKWLIINKAKIRYEV
jgi:hypothetical protein